MTTSPFPITVVVGYHRPNAIGTLDDQVFVVGEKSVMLGRPCLSLMCPPATKTRPSASRLCPEQNRLAGGATDVNAPVDGFHTLGVPVRPIESTRPSGKSIMWIATMGQANGAVHWPLSVDPDVANAGEGEKGVHGIPRFARAMTGLPSRKICTVPLVRVSKLCSLIAGSIAGAAGTAVLPSSPLPLTR